MALKPALSDRNMLNSIQQWLTPASSSRPGLSESSEAEYHDLVQKLLAKLRTSSPQDVASTLRALKGLIRGDLAAPSSSLDIERGGFSQPNRSFLIAGRAQMCCHGGRRAAG
mgnify:CR=1 FL=1